MKKLIAVCALFALVAGCSFDQIVTDQWGLLAIKNASRGLGYAVANSKTTADDQAVIAAYELLTKGQLTEVAMTELLKRLECQNPLVVFAALFQALPWMHCTRLYPHFSRLLQLDQPDSHCSQDGLRAIGLF